MFWLWQCQGRRQCCNVALLRVRWLPPTPFTLHQLMAAKGGLLLTQTLWPAAGGQLTSKMSRVRLHTSISLVDSHVLVVS